jgi:hypothetical protein
MEASYVWHGSCVHRYRLLATAPHPAELPYLLLRRLHTLELNVLCAACLYTAMCGESLLHTDV